MTPSQATPLTSAAAVVCYCGNPKCILSRLNGAK